MYQYHCIRLDEKSRIICNMIYLRRPSQHFIVLKNCLPGFQSSLYPAKGKSFDVPPRRAKHDGALSFAVAYLIKSINKMFF